MTTPPPWLPNGTTMARRTSGPSVSDFEARVFPSSSSVNANDFSVLPKLTSDRNAWYSKLLK